MKRPSTKTWASRFQAQLAPSWVVLFRSPWRVHFNCLIASRLVMVKCWKVFWFLSCLAFGLKFFTFTFSRSTFRSRIFFYLEQIKLFHQNSSIMKTILKEEASKTSLLYFMGGFHYRQTSETMGAPETKGSKLLIRFKMSLLWPFVSPLFCFENLITSSDSGVLLGLKVFTEICVIHFRSIIVYISKTKAVTGLC